MATTKITAAMVGMLLMLTVTSCASPESPAGNAEQDTQGPLVIGISLSESGEFADPSRLMRLGYELWAEKVNDEGGLLGRRVELKIVDDASSTSQVVTNYQNLITQDKVDLVFGPFSSLLTIPAGRVAARYDYAFLAPEGGGPDVFAEKLRNLFFVQPAPVVKNGEVFADYVLSLPNGQRPKTAAYPSLDDPFAAPIADNVRRRFEAAGIETTYDQLYPADTQEFGPIISKLSDGNPDVVVAGTQVEDAFNQVKAMSQADVNPNMYFLSNGANSPVDFPDNVGMPTTEGIFSTASWSPETDTKGNQEFIELYLKKHDGRADQIDANTADAYACGQLLEAIAEKTGKLDNETIIDQLHSRSWETIQGELSWDAYGEPQGSSTLVQWQDEQLTAVYPEDRAAAEPNPAKPAWQR